MQVGMRSAVLQIDQLGVAPECAPDVYRLASRRDAFAYPLRKFESALTTIVLERYRREQDRNRRGGGGCARQANLCEIRADQIEVVLHEGKAIPGYNVRGGCDRNRSRFVNEIAEGRAVEQDLVVVVRG